MPVFHAIVLGIVQGLSEFLPISSSGHLILVPDLLGWTEFTSHKALEKSFDVALHAGTLAAALWYFRSDVARLARAALHSLAARSITGVDERLAWLLVLSAVPGAVTGALFESVIVEHLSDPILIGVNLVVFGIVLDLADRRSSTRHVDDLHTRHASAMGVGQALALAPGVSRSGITISVARAFHYDRASATRVSFLMSLPIIGGATLYKGLELAQHGIPDRFEAAFAWGVVASAVSGWLAISVLLRLVRTQSFRPFVIYRVVFGLAVIVIYATGIR